MTQAQAPKKPYRRRILLIDRKFQLRFCLYVCSWIFVLSLAYPLIIQSVFNSALSYMTQDPYGPAIAALEATRKESLTILVTIQAVFIGVIFLLSLFVSHRIAGPLYKLRTFLDSAARGQVQTNLKFRKGDYFQNLADGYNGMVRGVLAARSREAGQIIALIEKGESDQALAALRRMQDLAP